MAPFSRESVTIDGKAAGLSTGDIRTLPAVANVKAVTVRLDGIGPGTIALIGSLPGAESATP